MQITATMLVELDEGDRQEFEDAHWRYDEHYEGFPYFQESHSGPFLVDLESVCYETREWLEKYNGGWEGFAISFTAEEHVMMQALMRHHEGRFVMALDASQALLYFGERFLTRLITEMAHDAMRKDA